MVSRKILLLPGMDGTGLLFSALVEALPVYLESHVVCYPPDRFLSYSELPAVVAEAARGKEPTVLLAESFSTPLAIEYAAVHPREVAAVILCAGFASSPMSVMGRSVLPLRRLAFRIPAPDFVLRYLLLESQSPRTLSKAVRAAVDSVAPDVLASRLQAIAECDVRESLRCLSAPILYVQATRDRVVGSSSFDEIKRLKPNTALARVIAPHLVLQCRPKETAKIIADFLEQLP